MKTATNKTERALLSALSRHKAEWEVLVQNGATDQEIEAKITHLWDEGIASKKDSKEPFCALFKNGDWKFYPRTEPKARPGYATINQIALAIRELLEIPVPDSSEAEEMPALMEAAEKSYEAAEAEKAAEEALEEAEEEIEEIEPKLDPTQFWDIDLGTVPIKYFPDDTPILDGEEAAHRFLDELEEQGKEFPKEILVLYQMRAHGNDEKIIDKWATVMRQGGWMPSSSELPQVISQIQRNIVFNRVPDGCKRTHAQQKSGLPLSKFPYQWRKGTRAEAELAAIFANRSHNLEREERDEETLRVNFIRLAKHPLRKGATLQQLVKEFVCDLNKARSWWNAAIAEAEEAEDTEAIAILKSHDTTFQMDQLLLDPDLATKPFTHLADELSVSVATATRRAKKLLEIMEEKGTLTDEIRELLERKNIEVVRKGKRQGMNTSGIAASAKSKSKTKKKAAPPPSPALDFNLGDYVTDGKIEGFVVELTAEEVTVDTGEKELTVAVAELEYSSPFEVGAIAELTQGASSFNGNVPKGTKGRIIETMLAEQKAIFTPFGDSTLTTAVEFGLLKEIELSDEEIADLEGAEPELRNKIEQIETEEETSELEPEEAPSPSLMTLEEALAKYGEEVLKAKIRDRDNPSRQGVLLGVNTVDTEWGEEASLGTAVIGFPKLTDPNQISHKSQLLVGKVDVLELPKPVEDFSRKAASQMADLSAKVMSATSAASTIRARLEAADEDLIDPGFKAELMSLILPLLSR